MMTQRLRTREVQAHGKDEPLLSKTVLVLDDDALIREMLRPALEGHALKFVGAATGAQAEAAVTRDRPDALIVDGLLPDTSGLAWIERQRRSGNDVPIFFISAFWKDAQTARKLTEQLGVRAVLPKPVDPEALARAVMEALFGGAEAGDEPLEVDELDIDVGSDVDLEDPRERSMLRMDAARTLSQRIRDLSDAFNRAYLRLDPVQLTDARQIAEKLEHLATVCGFSEVARSTGRLAAALKMLMASQSVKRESWLPVADQFEAALKIAREAAQVDRHALKPPPKLLAIDSDEAALKHLRALLPKSLCQLTTVATPEAALEAAHAEAPDALLVNLGFEAGALHQALVGLAPEKRLTLGFISDRPIGGELARSVRSRGAKALLSKPFVRDHVIEQLCQLLSVDTPPPRPQLAIVDTDRDFVEEMQFWAARTGMDARVLGGDTTMDQVLQVAPHAAVVDVSDERGLALVRNLRRLGRFRDLPVMGISRRGVSSRIAAVEAGTDVCMEAPVNFDELFTLLKSRLDVSRAVMERSARDPVTGLANRAAFLESLGQRLAELRRGRRPMSLLALRLSNADSLRGSLGPTAFDSLFADAAAILQRQFRVEDVRSRWDETTFLVALVGAHPQSVPALVQKLVGALPQEWRTASVHFPHDGSSLVELIQLLESRLVSR